MSPKSTPTLMMKGKPHFLRFETQQEKLIQSKAQKIHSKLTLQGHRGHVLVGFWAHWLYKKSNRVGTFGKIPLLIL